MEYRGSILNILKFAGAYIAFIIGSGFATGQEIMQFFASNGLYSIGSILISLILFIYFGGVILGNGYDFKTIKNHSHYKYFCGNILGGVYEILVPILLFISVIIMISGAGATLKEYYNLNYFVGCLIMAGLVLVAYICGLNKLINTIGFIGPVIVLFSLIVGFIILFKNYENLKYIFMVIENVNIPKAGGNWIRSGILYAAYNLVTSVLFFSTVGACADTRKEAVYGATLGSALLVFVILIMNLALLSKIEDIKNLAIPTLYFAKSISPLLGKVFSLVLLGGIFSTAAPNFWTVCNKISENVKINPKLIAIFVAVIAFMGGLLPFEKLVGNVYPLTGFLGIVLFVCILTKQISKRII